MYTITVDNIVIHDPSLEDATKIIRNGVITKKVNCADSFTFTIDESNYGYNHTYLTRSKVKVYRDNICIFSGRPLSMAIDFYNSRTYLCESDMAELNDTIVRPYSYSGTVAGYLQMMINQHNAQVDQSKQFVLGQVTVTGSIVRYTSEYKATWSELFEKTVNSDLGGYLYMNTGERFLNYYADSPFTSGQVLKTGENIIDFSEERNVESFATALIPLGAEDDVTGERLTIKSVNNGLDYLVDSVRSQSYGLIFKTMIWDDVTNAATLKILGDEYLLRTLTRMPRNIKITALDLNFSDRYIQALDFFRYVTVEDPYHNVSGQYLIKERKYNISSPEKDTITLEIGS